MARHNIILIASLLALVLFIAHTNAASSWEKEMEESCRKQIKDLNLKKCEKHIMKRIQKDEDEDEDENVLKMRGVNYVRRNHHEEDDLKEQCCAQLSDIMVCRCQALQEIMENLSDKLHKSEMEDMEREVKELPKRCNILPPIGCDLSMDN